LRKELLTSSAPTPEGPGSVWEAPQLPAGFTDTFAGRCLDTGQLRLHAVIGGDRPPLLLVHGWPQTWYQWRLVMPTMAQRAGADIVEVEGSHVTMISQPQAVTTWS
jgi:hypothetical protein